MPGRFKQSLEASSFDAWDVLYRPEPHHPNTTISYYTKGALVALALDLKLRLDTAGRTSLDDVMRELLAPLRRARRRRSRGRLRAARRRSQRARSRSVLRERGARHRRSAAERVARGVRRRARDARARRAPTTAAARGARRERRAADARRCGSRARARASSSTSVLDGGAAERAGLNPGDVLIAIDRLRVTGRNLARRLARFESGERVTASCFAATSCSRSASCSRPRRSIPVIWPCATRPSRSRSSGGGRGSASDARRNMPLELRRDSAGTAAHDRARAQGDVGVSRRLGARQPAASASSTAASTSARSAAATPAARTRCARRARSSRSGSWSSTSARASSRPP